MFETKYWRTQEYYAAKRPESGQTEAVRPLPADGDRPTGVAATSNFKPKLILIFAVPNF